jgi:hypothetical protein
MDSSNRPLIILMVITMALVLCAGFAYIGYAFSQYQAEIDEENLNYNAGLASGKEIGHETGYQEGYEAGLNAVEGGNDLYVTHDPTYQEMKDFLAADTADSKEYSEDSHLCTDFTAEVNKNAESRGIRCGTVYIIYKETGHSIIAFNTTDKGIIFIEPQYDKEVKLEIGESYSELNNFINRSGEDDIIVRYLIMW